MKVSNKIIQAINEGIRKSLLSFGDITFDETDDLFKKGSKKGVDMIKMETLSHVEVGDGLYLESDFKHFFISHTKYSYEYMVQNKLRYVGRCVAPASDFEDQLPRFIAGFDLKESDIFDQSIELPNIGCDKGDGLATGGLGNPKDQNGYENTMELYKNNCSEAAKLCVEHKVPFLYVPSTYEFKTAWGISEGTGMTVANVWTSTMDSAVDGGFWYFSNYLGLAPCNSLEKMKIRPYIHVNPDNFTRYIVEKGVKYVADARDE